MSVLFQVVFAGNSNRDTGCTDTAQSGLPASLNKLRYAGLCGFPEGEGACGGTKLARAKLWQANEFAFGKLGQYRAESDHKAERDPCPQASRACPFAEKEEQGSGRMASFSPKAKKKPEQSGLCSDVVPLTGVEPVRHCCLGILSPVCLPISPQRLTNTLLYSQSPPKSRKSAAAAWAKKSGPYGPPSPPGSPG